MKGKKVYSKSREEPESRRFSGGTMWFCLFNRGRTTSFSRKRANLSSVLLLKPHIFFVSKNFNENRKRTHFCWRMWTYAAHLFFYENQKRTHFSLSVIPFSSSVIPAQAGIHRGMPMMYNRAFMDSRLRGNDVLGRFEYIL